MGTYGWRAEVVRACGHRAARMQRRVKIVVLSEKNFTYGSLAHVEL